MSMLLNLRYLLLFMLSVTPNWYCGFSNSLLSNADWMGKMDLGYYAAVLKNPEVAQSLNFDPKPLPGYSAYEQLKANVAEMIRTNQFPIVETGSRTAENIPEQVRSMIIGSGLTPGNIDASIPYSSEKVSAYIPEYWALSLAWRIECAKIIESLLPSPTEAQFILNQIKVLKTAFAEMLTKTFPDLDKEELESIVDQRFIPFEKGPITLNHTAKRPLSTEQLQFIQQKWNEMIKENPSNAELAANQVSYKASTPKSLKRIALFKYTYPLAKLLVDEFDNNLPMKDILPVMPEQLKILEKQLSEDISIK